MGDLIGDSAFAAELTGFLDQQLASGFVWVVYDTDQPISSEFDLTFFTSAGEAHEFAKSYQQIFNWHQAVPVTDLIFNLKELYNDFLQVPGNNINQTNTSFKTKAMNLNNLEDRKEEMAGLGASEKTITKMEELMRSGTAKFTLHQPMPANKGQVDVQFHFQQSSKSENYFLNKFTVAHNLGKPLEQDQHYLVIWPNAEGKGGAVKKFDLVTEAIELFKNQKGVAELAIGKDAASKRTVASMEEGKVNYIEKSFRALFMGNLRRRPSGLKRAKVLPFSRLLK